MTPPALGVGRGMRALTERELEAFFGDRHLFPDAVETRHAVLVPEVASVGTDTSPPSS